MNQSWDSSQSSQTLCEYNQAVAAIHCHHGREWSSLSAYADSQDNENVDPLNSCLQCLIIQLHDIPLETGDQQDYEEAAALLMRIEGAIAQNALIPEIFGMLPRPDENDEHGPDDEKAAVIFPLIDILYLNESSVPVMLQCSSLAADCK